MNAPFGCLTIIIVQWLIVIICHRLYGWQRLYSGLSKKNATFSFPFLYVLFCFAFLFFSSLLLSSRSQFACILQLLITVNFLEWFVLKGLIISAKKYLKMPAATEPPEAKTEREELLWQALKEHIMLERQKKKEGT